ncbi:helix-turn-helix domain-containing protein [Sphingobacterium sp. UBA5670]|uniref:helix-turn-helix domain-containing protein n=1 Tax=Sphingobacterium sp. UBA5670 TaxID=1947502 RepID=UPI0025D06D74|nr:AraC family transcriptional regulator [Sphingobacterium sp. UBA5670]
MLGYTKFNAGNIATCGEHVEHLGFLYQMWNVRKYTSPQVQNEDLRLTLIHSKGGTHYIDQGQYNMEGYQIHLVFPGQSNYFYFLEETSAYQIRISWQNFEKLCHNLSINIKLLKDYPILQISPAKFETLRHEFNKIRIELCHLQPPLLLIATRIATILQEIKRLITRQIDNLAAYTYPPMLISFLELIEQHYKQQHRVSYYASTLNVTSNYLSKLTRRHMQVKPLKLIHDRLIKEAQHLLRSSSCPIKSIIIELGFEDFSTFSHFFKKRTNMSPLAYQKKMQSLKA